MEPHIFNLILLGDPASGKGTQAARLVKRYRLYNFDMGAEVRKPAVRAKYDYAKTTGAGHLTPTSVVRNILRRVIRTTAEGQGILFNGHPKMIGEAKLTAKFLREAKRIDPIIIYLKLPIAEILRRAEKRRVKLNGKWVKRDDDTTRALRNRRAYYQTQVARTVIFFKKRYRFAAVSGMGSEAAVWKRIVKVIDYNAKNS